MSKSAIAHRPSYNPKVLCQCGRDMKATQSVSCRKCAADRRKAEAEQRRGSPVPERISDESMRASLDQSMSKDWLRKPLRVWV